MEAWIRQNFRLYKFDFLALMFFLLLPFVIHWNVFFGSELFPRIYPFSNDFVQTYNALSLTTKLLSDGEIGLWFPYKGFGTPYFAWTISGLLYPPTIILSKLNDPQQALLFSNFVIYHLMTKSITCCFFYWFMRSLTINRWGALIGSMAWGFNLRFDDIIRSAGAAHTLMWFPLLVLIAFKMLRSPDKRYMGYFALLFALTYFANYAPYIVYSMGFILLFFIFFPLDGHPDFSKRKYKLALFYLGTALALGACLVAVQLLPSLEFIEYWNRSGGLSLSETMIYRCKPSQTFLGYFFPAVAYTERDHYIGLFPLILAAIGLFSHDQRYRFKKMFAFTIVVTAVYSTKSIISHPFQKFLYDYVPFFDGLRCPGRSLILNMFCLSVLSGYGMDTLTGLKPIQENVKRIMVTIAAVLVSSCIIVWLLPKFGIHTLDQVDRYDYVVWAVSSFLLLAIPLSRRGDRGWSRIFPYLAVVIITANFLFATYRKNTGPHEGPFYYRKKDPRIIGTKSLITNCVNEEYFHIPPKEVERIGRIDSLAFQPLLFLNSVLPSSSPPFSRYGYEGSLFDTNYFFIRTRESRRVRSILNTRFDVQYFLPRAYVVYQLEKLQRDEIMEEMLSPDFDPLNKHYVEEDLPAGFRALLTGKREIAVDETDRLSQIKEETDIIEYENDLVKIGVNIPRPGFLFLSDVFFPGWKASIDESPIKIYRTNFLFRGIPVPEGKHTVTFVYQPFRFYLGLTLSVTALVIVLAIIASGRRYYEGASFALVLLLCYGPLAWPGSRRETHQPLESISPYNVESAEGIAGSISPGQTQLVRTSFYLEEDGIYDFLIKFPPQAYHLYVDNELVATIFNTGAESPPPEKGWWEVQAILKLKKGNHEFQFKPIVPEYRVKPVFNKLVPRTGELGQFDIHPIAKSPRFQVRRIKLVPH